MTKAYPISCQTLREGLDPPLSPDSRMVLSVTLFPPAASLSWSQRGCGGGGYISQPWSSFGLSPFPCSERRIYLCLISRTLCMLEYIAASSAVTVESEGA